MKLRSLAEVFEDVFWSDKPPAWAIDTHNGNMQRSVPRFTEPAQAPVHWTNNEQALDTKRSLGEISDIWRGLSLFTSKMSAV